LIDLEKLKKMAFEEINKRYSELADTTCCLSCGGAINHSEAAFGEICVDLGSGRGTDVLRLAENVGSTGFVYGIDISDGMILKAKSNAGRLGISNVEFIHSQLERIILPDNTADLIISNCTINHSNDKQSVWNEVFRILKSGGRFVVSDIYATSPVADEYKNDPVAIAECWAGSVTREEYLSQLNAAGFTSIRILEESEPYEKGKATVASWTIYGEKPSCDCNSGKCSNCQTDNN
jgi:ubiquinone/menaquinone biosynthesis C-methylase UbiE